MTARTAGARSLVVGAVMGAFACADPVESFDVDVRIVTASRPVVAAPGDSVLLVGTAHDTRIGALPDSVLTWFVDGEEQARGGALPLAAPIYDGTVRVVLEARYGDVTARDSVEVRGLDARSVLWSASVSSVYAYAPEARLVYATSAGRLRAIDRRGGQRWTLPVERLLAASDGHFYAMDGPRGVIAIDPSGSVVWSTGEAAQDIVIAADGTLRVLSGIPGGSRLAKWSAVGELEWEVELSDASLQFIDRQDRTYLATTIRPRSIVVSRTGAVLADVYVDEEQLAARCPAALATRVEMVPGPGDNVYFWLWRRYAGEFTSCLVAANAFTGEIAWVFVPDEMMLTSPPVVAADGTAILAIPDGSVLAIDADGNPKWRSDPVPTNCWDSVHGTPLHLAAGDIIFVHFPGRLRALRAEDGARLWEIEVSESTACGPNITVLISDGWIFMPGQDNVVAVVTGVGPDTAALWPQWYGDYRRSRLAGR